MEIIPAYLDGVVCPSQLGTLCAIIPPRVKRKMAVAKPLAEFATPTFLATDPLFAASELRCASTASDYPAPALKSGIEAGRADKCGTTFIIQTLAAYRLMVAVTRLAFDSQRVAAVSLRWRTESSMRPAPLEK